MQALIEWKDIGWAVTPWNFEKFTNVPGTWRYGSYFAKEYQSIPIRGLDGVIARGDFFNFNRYT